MNNIRFATIGTSWITEAFIGATKENEASEVRMVYSRDLERGSLFAKKNSINEVVTSIEEIAKSKHIDAVYIASPNCMHAKQAIALMRAGKHIICEKALASNKGEVEEMYRVSREEGVVLMEAIRNTHDQVLKEVRELLPSLGVIRKARFEFCQYSSKYDAFLRGEQPNIFKKELSAGALMDLGVYCVHPCVYLFGKPQELKVMPVFLENGADGAGTILARYEGMVAELSYSKITDGGNESVIQGEQGSLYIQAIHNPSQAYVKYRDGNIKYLSVKEQDNNMGFELEDFIKMIRGEMEGSIYEEASLETISLMDEVRKQMGLCFPADNEK